MIQFLLHNQLIQADDLAPWTSVLEYLRTRLALIGTKEGCAAGDCGACTVVVGEVQGNKIHYKAINACITPIASLHGKQLLTVEHLQHRDQLHPVQQAMVDCHGSQCGFCTPGIVMSLLAWWKNQIADPSLASRHGVETALSGNLCRCTGYQPIFRAAETLLQVTQTDAIDEHQNTVIAALEAIQSGEPGELQSAEQRFLLPLNLAQLLALKQTYPHAQWIAGATDLGLEFTQNLQTPAVLIYTGHVKECLVVEDNPKYLSLGAALTYSAIEPLLQRYLPAFAQLLQRLGSLQIRNQGTLAGNVANASPIGDTPPVLLALAAEVELASPSALRKVAIDQFFRGYRQTQMAADECITRIVLPKLTEGQSLQVYKISKRFDDDISAVCVAIWLQTCDGIITDARLGCGGMAATPARAHHAEQCLIGQVFAEQTFVAAGAALRQDFTPIDDVRASKEYRLAVAANLLLRAYFEQCGTVPTHLFDSHQAATISGGYYRA